ncbi:hypothetical protein R83H12_02912 [Fibrobacteria bacterium R8-3-H12]
MNKLKFIDDGELKIYEYIEENTVNYSINNNILTWKYIRKNDTLNFKGTSNELIGTWTRTKDKYHLIEEYWKDYYYDILEKDFNDCLKRILPAELFEDDEDDSYGAVAAKPLANANAKSKTKFTWLLKKKK